MRACDDRSTAKFVKADVEPVFRLRACRAGCGGPCDMRMRVDCQPKCGGFCLNNAVLPEVPPQVKKNWEDLYDKVMKRSGDVGCQPYFAPPNPMAAARITERLYSKQTIYQDKIRNALKRQIRARKEDDDMRDVEDDFVDTSKALNRVDIDLLRILNAPPIDVAYRNYMGRTKESIEEEEKEKNTQTVNIPLATKEEKPRKKALIDPAERKKDFIPLAKMFTAYDEEITQDVENLWAALGPLMIELDHREKRKALKKISKALRESKAIQREEKNRIRQENQAELGEFMEAKSIEMDKKYNKVLTLLKESSEKSKTFSVRTLLKSCEDLNNYEIEWAKTESAEKFQESVRVFTHYCNLWMRIMESIDAKTKLNARQLMEKDYDLIMNVQKMEEERILKSLNRLNRQHELIESTLADYLYVRDKTANELLALINELKKKVDIWKNLVNDLMKQFQKFVTYTLGEQPMLTQYLLSMDAMYTHFLDDSLKKEQRVKEKEADKEIEVVIRKNYPACALPDRLSDGSTVTSQTSTSRTEPGIPKSKIPEAIMTGIATGEFPEYFESYDELEYRQEQEVEAVVQTFGYEETDEDEKLIMKKQLIGPSSRSETSDRDIVHGESIKDAGDDDCANLDQSTRNKIEAVIKLMHEKQDFMKGYINF